MPAWDICPNTEVLTCDCSRQVTTTGDKCSSLVKGLERITHSFRAKSAGRGYHQDGNYWSYQGSCSEAAFLWRKEHMTCDTDSIAFASLASRCCSDGVSKCQLPVTTPAPSLTTLVADAPADTEHVLTLTVTLPYTKADFTEAKKTLFKAAVAKTAGTVSANVDILSVTESRRRAGSIAVETRIRAPDTEGLTAIKDNLGNGDALKTKLDTELKTQGLAESTGVTAPIVVAAVTNTGVQYTASAAVLVFTATVCVLEFL